MLWFYVNVCNFRCVDASNSKEGLWLDNRQIYANPAISKEDADETAKKKKEKIAKDNRYKQTQ